MPIVKTEASRGEGVEELAEKIAEHRAHIEEEGTLAERRKGNLRNEVIALATARTRRKIEARVNEDDSCRSCSTRSWPAGSTRRAPRPSCWSASFRIQACRSSAT